MDVLMHLLVVGVEKGLADMLAALIQVDHRVDLEALLKAYENLN